jgi:hypothetical protein
MEVFTMNDLTKLEKNDNRGNSSNEKAVLIRAILGLGELTGKLDPWLPFPQNSCCFLFGKDKLPIPVGALLYLWENSSLFTGECPHYGGKTYSYAFGGLLNIGDIRGCCISCDKGVSNSIGGLGVLNQTFRPILQDTPYYINGMIFGGTYEGKRWPLIRALRKLGIKDLPDYKWAMQREPSAASFSVQCDGKYKKMSPMPLDTVID